MKKTKTEDKNEECRRENKIEMLIKTGKVKFTLDNGIVFDKINTSEDSLLTLMLYAGYITLADEKGVYRIANNEVRYQFFDRICKAWFSDEEMLRIQDQGQ